VVVVVSMDAGLRGSRGNASATAAAARLSASSASGVVEATVVTLVKGPGPASGSDRARTTTWALPPGGIVPNGHSRSTALTRQLPWLGVASTRSRPGGETSSTRTLRATDGPPLATVST
jgi:hypothetical protein